MTWNPDGIRTTSDGNEAVVRQKLTEWIEDSGGSVYWDKCPKEEDRKTFSINTQRGLEEFTDDSQEETDEEYYPDMVAVFDDHCIVIEVKVGEEYGNAMEGVWQTFDYWQKYEQEKPRYETDDGSYEPDSFVLATRCSPYGHLFPANNEFLYENEVHESSINECLPKYEGNMTGIVARMLGRFARGTEEQSVGLGVLVSSVLEDLNGQQDDLDSEKMMRADALEATGDPAIYHRKRGNQDWIVL